MILLFYDTSNHNSLQYEQGYCGELLYVSWVTKVQFLKQQSNVRLENPGDFAIHILIIVELNSPWLEFDIELSWRFLVR